MKKKAVVLGDGAWGTAIATALAHKKIKVALWCHDAEVARSIAQERMNHRYLAGVVLSPLIIPMTDIHEALNHSDYVYCAVPVVHLRSVLLSINRTQGVQKTWIMLSKGMEVGSGLFSSQIVLDIFGSDTECMVASGPSYAAELAREQMTSMVFAVNHNVQTEKMRNAMGMLFSSYVRLIFTEDVIGVECAGMYKNIIALAVGIAQGAGCGENTQAAIITRGLAYLSERIARYGGQVETAYGLAGVGDVILTAKGGLSKNVLIGRQLGAGVSLADLTQQHSVLPEGVNSCYALLSNERDRDPLVRCVGAVFEGTLSAQSFVDQLFSDVQFVGR